MYIATFLCNLFRCRICRKQTNHFAVIQLRARALHLDNPAPFQIGRLEQSLLCVRDSRTVAARIVPEDNASKLESLTTKQKELRLIFRIIAASLMRDEALGRPFEVYVGKLSPRDYSLKRFSFTPERARDSRVSFVPPSNCPFLIRRDSQFHLEQFFQSQKLISRPHRGNFTRARYIFILFGYCFTVVFYQQNVTREIKQLSAYWKKMIIITLQIFYNSQTMYKIISKRKLFRVLNVAETVILIRVNV